MEKKKLYDITTRDAKSIRDAVDLVMKQNDQMTARFIAYSESEWCMTVDLGALDASSFTPASDIARVLNGGQE